MAKSKITEVFFLIDGKRIEAQSTLLAATCKRYLTSKQRAAAYVREDYLDEMDPFTHEILQASDVDLRVLPNTAEGHAPWQSPYPEGNKLIAAAQPRDCDISVFLDSDTVLAEPVDFAAELGTALVAACVSDYASETGSLEDWEAFYTAFDLPLPEERVQLLSGRKLTSLPYYNAGVVIFRERKADGTPTNFGRDWLDAAIWFDQEVTHPYARANIDQFTLPILGYQVSKPVKALNNHLNFNIKAYGDGEGERQSIAHYHQIGALWKHCSHGAMALDALVEVSDASAPERFLEVFGLHARRKDLKHHLRARAAA